MKAEQVIQMQIERSEPILVDAGREAPREIYLQQNEYSKKKEQSRNEANESSVISQNARSSGLPATRSMDHRNLSVLSGHFVKSENPTKLQTIQSVPHEHENSTGDTLDNKATQQQTLTVFSSKQPIEDNAAKFMEFQIQQLNQAISEMRTAHGQQINELKHFYDHQIKQIRDEQHQRSGLQQTLRSGSSSTQTQEILQKLMNQDKFQETINQLSHAVGQKESLEQKLTRIKEKIQKAKEIKRHPPLPVSSPTAFSSMPLSFYNSMTTAPYGAHLIESIKSPTLGDYTAQVTHGADTIS